MNLQFGCVKLHIGKRQHDGICTTLTIDSWEKEIYEKEDGNKSVKDTFKGREAMNEVYEKKYLGDLISRDGINKKNIKDRTNKAQGNLNKIMQGHVCLAHLCLLIWWINMLQWKQEISILIKIKLKLLCWQWWMTHWG